MRPARRTSSTWSSSAGRIEVIERTATDEGHRSSTSAAESPPAVSAACCRSRSTRTTRATTSSTPTTRTPTGNLEVDRFHAKSNSRAQGESRHRVIVIPHPELLQPQRRPLAFGPGGDLYRGDGGRRRRRRPARERAEPHVLLGKLLRIDPHAHGKRPYSVPTSNPFVGKPGRDEIYALGLRNPFRFSFDAGRILIGDVGQDQLGGGRLRGPQGAFAAPTSAGTTSRATTGFNFPGDNEAPRPKHRYRPPDPRVRAQQVELRRRRLRDHRRRGGP